MGRVALSPKQEQFVTEYLVDLNATQAAIRAGYSPKTAYSMGQRLLKKVEMQKAIQEARIRQQKRTEITADRVLKEYARIAFFDPRGLFMDNGKPLDINELDSDTAAALAGLDVMEEYTGYGESRVFIGYTKKYKIADKLRALDALAKHLGLFERDNPGDEYEPGGVIEMAAADPEPEPPSEDDAYE